MLKDIPKETINKIQVFIDEHTQEELAANEKILLRKFFRQLRAIKEIDGYSMDYLDKNFRAGITKDNHKEHIFYIREKDE